MEIRSYSDMKHKLTMTVETPEPGVFVFIIKDGEEVIDTIRTTRLMTVAVCAYRPGHSKPLRPIYGPTAEHLMHDAQVLAEKGYEVVEVRLQRERRGTLIYPDGNVRYIRPEDGKQFTLEELYKLLDCELVQVIDLGCAHKILIVDEEGKFKENPQFNLRATSIAYRFQRISISDRIVGKVMLCDVSMFR